MAVFNRESQPLEYTLTPSELGFTSGVVRDLWEHRNLPQQSSYEFDIPVHDCVVLKISKP
ncbi:MAG: hypothetical protein ACLU9X_06860 [Alistipes shahii]